MRSVIQELATTASTAKSFDNSVHDAEELLTADNRVLDLGRT